MLAGVSKNSLFEKRRIHYSKKKVLIAPSGMPRAAAGKNGTGRELVKREGSRLDPKGDV
jgi:hypothetical protein